MNGVKYCLIIKIYSETRNTITVLWKPWKFSWQWMVHDWYHLGKGYGWQDLSERHSSDSGTDVRSQWFAFDRCCMYPKLRVAWIIMWVWQLEQGDCLLAILVCFALYSSEGEHEARRKDSSGGLLRMASLLLEPETRVSIIKFVVLGWMAYSNVFAVLLICLKYG